jgi:hypothetical protein
MAISLSHTIDADTATAARSLREWFSTPGGADLCAGGRIDSATLERIETAVSRLRWHLARVRSESTATLADYTYTFDVVDAHGTVVSAISVRSDLPNVANQMREVAAHMLADHPDVSVTGARRLSHDAPRITPSAPRT